LSYSPAHIRLFGYIDSTVAARGCQVQAELLLPGSQAIM